LSEQAILVELGGENELGLAGVDVDLHAGAFEARDGAGLQDRVGAEVELEDGVDGG
jgi:hypothetical protein